LRVLAVDAEMPPVRVQAVGYVDAAERAYLAGIQREMADAGLADRFEYLGEPDRADKIAFLQSLDAFCLPTVYRESKGLSVLEAWANAVPVVIPSHGAFPEMMADTGGGVLCEPNSPPALAAALKRLALDPDFASQCGLTAQRAVRERYNSEVMARQIAELYRELTGRVPAKTGL
jgi:glycosyltransferase involved in cell wall biosynthesis